MHTDTNRQSKTSDQRGMVSMMVTMIMMIVISLIVLGFAQVSRREQRQSLDRQLSSQAFFAAESGINDARKTIQRQLDNGAPIVDKTACPTTATDANYPFNPVIDAGHNVSYTCLLVSSKLKNVVNQVSATGRSINFPLQPSSGAIDTIHIKWQAATNPTASEISGGCASGSNIPAASFPKAAEWKCPFGVLRIDIVPTQDMSRAATTAGQKTWFLYPVQGGNGRVNYATATGTVVPVKCQSAGVGCDLQIDGVGGSSTYMVRLTAVFVDGTADVSASDNGTPLSLDKAQIQVDATGRAQDVLRRMQVRLPIAPTRSTPDYAIESGSSICKRFNVNATTFQNAADIVGQDQDNPMCR